MRLLLLLVALADADALGPPLKQDGYRLRPPRGFHLARMELYRGSHAFAVGAGKGTPRQVSAVLVDGDVERDDSATLALAVIDEALEPSARDAWPAEVTRHFQDVLGLPFTLERCQSTPQRFECLGAVTQHGQARRVVVATWPNDGRHTVAVASVPTARWETFAPVLAESFGTFGYEALTTAPPARRTWWSVLAAVAGLFAASVWLWRRRAALRARR